MNRYDRRLTVEAVLDLADATGCSVEEAMVAVETVAAFADNEPADRMNFHIAVDPAYSFGFTGFRVSQGVDSNDIAGEPS